VRCSYGRIYGILRSRVVLRPSNGRGPRRTLEYVKVAEIMRERIINGDWRPGRKILAQQELAKIFDVRHQTIREAIAHLRQRGYLLRNLSR
jgi:DNA-binding GntR family transcriptional regulator